MGKLRRGSKTPMVASSKFAWKKKCVFVHPGTGKKASWICERPESDPHGWGVGCWVCEAAGAPSAYARLALKTAEVITLQSFCDHAKSRQHQDSLEKLRKRFTGDADEQPADVPEAAVSGIKDVPRLDRFMVVASMLANHEAYTAFPGHVEEMRVGSALETGSKGGPEEAKKILLCLEEPLRDVALKTLKTAVAASIALDKSSDILLVIARVLIPEGIHDLFLGLQTEVGPDIADANEAVQQILRRICTDQKGKRDPKACSDCSGRL